MNAQLRLIPDTLTPHQIAAKRLARISRAIAKHGPQGRSHRAIAAMHEVIDTAVIGRVSGKN